MTNINSIKSSDPLEQKGSGIPSDLQNIGQGNAANSLDSHRKMLSIMDEMMSTVMKLMTQNKNVEHTNYAYIVLTVFILFGLLPLQVNIGDIGNNVNQISKMQESMTEMQSFMSYVESIVQGPDGTLPANWQTEGASIAKLQSLASSFYSFFYYGDSSNPTLGDLYFLVRRPPSEGGGYYKVYFFDGPNHQGQNMNPEVLKLLQGLGEYFAGGQEPSASGPQQMPGIFNNGIFNGSDPTQHFSPTDRASGLMMLLFRDVQMKLDGLNQYLKPVSGSTWDDNAANFDFASAYGIEDSEGNIDPQALPQVNSTIGAAYSLYSTMMGVPQDAAKSTDVSPAQFGWLLLYWAQNKLDPQSIAPKDYPGWAQAVDNPTKIPLSAFIDGIGYMAKQYWDSQNPTTANKPTDPNETKGSLLEMLADTAGTAQSTADNSSSNLMTKLQSVSQEMTTEVQTGQQIAQSEAKSEQYMVQSQKSA